MRTVIQGLVLVLVAVLAGTVAWRVRGSIGPSSPYELTGSIEDIMQGMVEPNADAIFQSVAVITTAAGVEERQPRTDEDWAGVEHAALTLAEAANLIRMPGRTVADPMRRRGPESEAVPELTPEQIQEKIRADPEQWTRHAAVLVVQARRTLEYARARNVKGLFDVGGDLDEACDGCHKVYWYPNAPEGPGEN